MALSEFRAGVYEHYKGGQYLVLGIARCDETGEPLVVYVRLYSRPGGIPMTVRSLESFLAVVQHNGETVPRFQWLGTHQPDLDQS